MSPSKGMKWSANHTPSQPVRSACCADALDLRPRLAGARPEGEPHYSPIPRAMISFMISVVPP